MNFKLICISQRFLSYTQKVVIMLHKNNIFIKKKNQGIYCWFFVYSQSYILSNNVLLRNTGYKQVIEKCFIKWNYYYARLKRSLEILDLQNSNR